MQIYLLIYFDNFDLVNKLRRTWLCAMFLLTGILYLGYWNKHCLFDTACEFTSKILNEMYGMVAVCPY